MIGPLRHCISIELLVGPCRDALRLSVLGTALLPRLGIQQAQRSDDDHKRITTSFPLQLQSLLAAAGAAVPISSLAPRPLFNAAALRWHACYTTIALAEDRPSVSSSRASSQQHMHECNSGGKTKGVAAAATAPRAGGPSATDLQILTAVAKGGPQHLAQLLDLLRQRRSIELLNAALRSVPASLLQPLLDLLHEGAEWPQPTLQTALLLLERLEREGLRRELDTAMQRLLSAGMHPHRRVHLAWAQQHAQAGSVRGVRHVMQLVQHFEPDGKVPPHYYVQLIRAYCTCGRLADAEEVLEEMRRAGVPPNEHIYRALIWGCGHFHRADRAAHWFEAMVSSGVPPSPATWSALLNAYAESKQPRRAVEAMAAMRAQGLTPPVQAYGALAKGFARSGDWRRAHEVLQLMAADGVQPNEQVYGSIIEAAAVAGKPSVAAELVRRMQAAGIQPNVVVYTSLLSSYGATGDVEAAEGVLREMQAAGCRPNGKTYTELMSQLAARGRYEETEQYFQEMVAAGWPADRVSYAILIDSMLHRWAADREGQAHLLQLVQARWDEASGRGRPLEPNTFLHQPQGRLTLDLHGYSAWTAQLAVLATLDSLLQQHTSLEGGVGSLLTRLDVITGKGNRSERRHRPVLRELVVEMLQHLLPVSFGRSNDGLLVLHARDLRRLFDIVQVAGKRFSLRDMHHCLTDPSSV